MCESYSSFWMISPLVFAGVAVLFFIYKLAKLDAKTPQALPSIDALNTYEEDFNKRRELVEKAERELRFKQEQAKPRYYLQVVFKDGETVLSKPFEPKLDGGVYSSNDYAQFAANRIINSTTSFELDNSLYVAGGVVRVDILESKV